MDNINNEHRLIVELQTGSRTAFKAIYDMYAERLYSFVFSYLHSRSEAEDIVQDVFVRLWQSREQIRQTESLKSLLFIISRNRIVSEYRKRVNEPAFSDYMACRDAVSDGCGDGELEYNEFVERLHAALRRLPQRQRDIINMSRMDGMRNKDIARKLGLSEQTVKNQLSLGLKTVRAALARGVFPAVLADLFLLLI